MSPGPGILGPAPPPRIVAVIGAECSGKSVLAAALGSQLPGAVVGESLRAFTSRHGRPPHADEQRAVMRAQIAAEDAAARRAGGWVVSDSGALTTAVYSLLYFGDDSLVGEAIARHRTGYCCTVWCDIDLPWVPDPGQRDGPGHRERAHRILGHLLAHHHLPVLRVSGPPADRVAAVLEAVRDR